MPKGKILEDTFEQLVELGQTTVKQTGKAVAQTFSPLKLIESAFSLNPQNSPNSQESLKSPKSHTSLNFEKLQKNYDKNDAKKTNALRLHLFNLVRRADEKSLAERRQKELEKKRREEMERQEKKRKEEEKKKLQASPLPKGKVRQRIFSPKKVAERSHAEIRPATGKQ